ncbi:MAG: hypothetical protein VB065_01495, partial [Eubacteriales bacterium]|nr:hypothetical protein [Eubacteriales bacterium]
PEIPEQPEVVEPAINPDDLQVEITPVFAGEKPQYGEAVRLLSVVLGAPEGAALDYQWQYLPDGGGWTDVPGANGRPYEFVLDEANIYYTWRLLVTPVNEAA